MYFDFDQERFYEFVDLCKGNESFTFNFTFYIH